MAAMLIDRGLEPGDVVGVWLTGSTNTPFNGALMWAIIRAGGVIYSVHPHGAAIGSAENLSAQELADAPPAPDDIVWPALVSPAPLLLNQSPGPP